MGTSENVRTWSTTAATNSAADAGINWAEGQAASTVNDSARSMMAAIAKLLSDTQGALTTSGSANTYTASTATGYTSLATGLTLCAKFNAANTGASTLNVDSLGAKAIRKFVSGAESALSANDLVTNNHYMLVYDTAVNSAAGGWVVMNPSTVGSSSIAANSIDNTLLATMANGTIKSRVTAGTGNAEDKTLSQIIDVTSSTQGSLLYRNASAWVALAPGTSGQVLQSGGAGANPSWLSVSGVGTVTSVATSGFVSGGTITTSGTISLGSMGAASRLMGSGSGAATITNLTAGTFLSIGASSLDMGVMGATSRLMGSSSSSTAITNITPGDGLSMSGSTLSAKFAQVANTSSAAVATGTTVMVADDTIPQNTEGDQYLSVSITPTSATSVLLIRATLVLANSAAGSMIVALFQDTTANALAAVISKPVSSGDIITIPLQYAMTSGTTSSTTFKIRAGGTSAGTTTLNGSGGSRLLGGVMSSSLIIEEIR